MGTFGENKMKGEMFNYLIISKIKTNKWTKTYAGPHKIKNFYKGDCHFDKVEDSKLEKYFHQL